MEHSGSKSSVNMEPEGAFTTRVLMGMREELRQLEETTARLSVQIRALAEEWDIKAAA